MEKQQSTIYKAIFIVIIFVITLCTHSYATNVRIHKEYKLQQEIWLTIFVHGIMSIKPHLSLSNFVRFIRDDIKNTLYMKTVEIMRNDTFFYLNQAMQGFGLKKINLNKPSPENIASAIAFIYNQVDQLHATPHKHNHYYTFGWSGLLSPVARYEAAELLFSTLVKELNLFLEQRITPKIRLICYSHGGNVALNLAEIYQKKHLVSPFIIDELILIGVPIQSETEHLVADRIFKEIYHFYSRADRIQRIDFFSFNRFLSRRTFQHKKSFKVPSKVFQIQLKVMRNVSTNKKRKDRYQALTKNVLNTQIISGKSHLLRDVSPGHMELWFFGWTPQSYRKNFILNPLPMLVTIPHIIHHIKQIKHAIHTPFPLIADIRPEQEIMIIKQHKKNNLTKVFPFIAKKDLDHYGQIARNIAPQNYTQKNYDQHIFKAFYKAQQQQYSKHPKNTTAKHTSFNVLNPTHTKNLP